MTRPWYDGHPIHGYSHSKPPPGVFNRHDMRGDTVIGCDVCIVGSGAGGATAAAELAEAGFDVAVIEEGSYWGTRDFGTNGIESVRRMYRSAAATAAIGAPPIIYQEGRTVGGSSVINGGMSWRTPEKILDGWVNREGLEELSAKKLEPYFDRVERRISVGTQDPGTTSRDNEILREGAEKKGWDYAPNRRNQLHCAGSNNCAFGCPTGAKQSTLVSYIPRALHFGARVYSNIKVERITRKGKRATGVVGHVVRENGKPGARVTVKARLVISACGSIHTPALLHRSGFRSPSGQLGHNLSMHPNVKVVAFYDEPVRGWEGVHQAYQVHEFRDQGIGTLAAVNVPPSLLAVTLHHYGEELGRLLGDYENALVAGLLVEDESRGRVWTTPWGAPVATYRMAPRDVDRLLRGTALLCELLFDMGARRIVMPFGGIGELESPDDIPKIFSDRVDAKTMEVVTVHMMGTARMGADRSRAVTDSFGAVYDTDRLFVCDASLFPSPVGVNPAETIQTLATSNAAHIIENRGRYLA